MPNADAPNYKDTLNLPKTAFNMKANLVQNEPASIKRWDTIKLYAQLRSRPHPRGAFVAHDGPPYANGDIHLGHLLNKVLKDFVVRSRSMMGYDCPYTPGWDCHGLPIEHKVMQEWEQKGAEGTGAKGSGKEKSEASATAPPSAPDVMKIRNKCKSYAEKFVKTQKAQMQRLLTLADYEDPYLTMLPRYEAGVLDVFAGMIDAGLVYRDKKPVHWSIDNRTALAEAELEYYDRIDTSVYVWFASSDDANVGFMIWTTTPWTLPANLAVAVHPRFDYGLYTLPNGKQAWMACALADNVFARIGARASEPTITQRGEQLVGKVYQHPFIDRKGKVVAAEYVTAEDGTGLVHTAPGHGAEDYQTGLREGLPVYCPVLEDGTYDDTVPDWLRGMSIWKANDLIVDRLRDSGHLFHSETFSHSYPHDWRGKQPVIFRATEQWFIGVDKPMQRDGGSTLRSAALQATQQGVRFIPEWGRNRMRGMLESRPDWCVSRQRAWGLPIPAFFNENNEPLLTAESVRAVARMFNEKGSDAWFLSTPQELLKHYDPSTDAHAPGWAHADGFVTLRKGGDTFDVWFESGSSWNAVLRSGWRDQQAGEAFPAELYLEGSDQHRGWFQHSLLPALAVTGVPPFKAILTHGFMVDKDGKKMSKSLGNTLNVDDLMKDYGADVCRWWVASLNTDNDIKVDPSYFKLAGESYRKVRNTLRFLLSNLSDFDIAQREALLRQIKPTSLEAWLLSELSKLQTRVVEAYERYQFSLAHRALFDFSNETLSAVYLAAVKDRMYCDATGSPRRREAQAVMHVATDALCRLLGPMLPHTADEAWRMLPGVDQATSIHAGVFGSIAAVTADARWASVMAERETWQKALESARQQGIENPLDAGLRVADDKGVLSGFDPVDLADLCGVSRFVVDAAVNGVQVDDLRDDDKFPKCARSWKRDGTVRPRSDGGMLSDRDASALGLA